MKVMFDNNLSETIARAIAVLSEEKHLAERVVHLQEVFPAHLADTARMDGLGAQGACWVVITRDMLNKRAGEERKAIRRNGLIAYVLDNQWASQTFWPMASRLVDWWPLIVQHARTARAGVYRVPWKKGTARQLTSC
jgi:hypothetical protein